MKKVKIILILLTLIITVFPTVAQDKPEPIEPDWITENIVWNLSEDTTIDKPIEIGWGGTLTINNTSDKDITIRLGHFPSDYPFERYYITTQSGGKLHINGKPNARIIFDGGNSFQMDTISSKGRYFLNNNGIEYFPEHRPGTYLEGGISDAIAYDRVINNQGYVDITFAKFQNFQTVEGVIFIKAEGSYDSNTEPNSIAEFKNVDFYHNRTYNEKKIYLNVNPSCVTVDNTDYLLIPTSNPDSFKISFDNCKFSENSLGNSGCIYTAINTCSNIYISNTIFEKNYSIYNGGAITSDMRIRTDGYYPTLYISNCIFYKNQAELDGGAIQAMGAIQFDSDPATQTIISGNVAGGFESNVSGEFHNFKGGGISIDIYPALLGKAYTYNFPANLIVHHNKSSFGGGISITGESYWPDKSEDDDDKKDEDKEKKDDDNEDNTEKPDKIYEVKNINFNISSVITHNESFENENSYGGGGGLLLDNKNYTTDALHMNINIDGAKIIGNKSHFKGGGILANNSFFTIGNDNGNLTEIKDNYSATNGGGLALIASELDIKNCEISGNTVPNYGGGIYVDTDSYQNPVKLTYHSGKIINNKASGWNPDKIYYYDEKTNQFIEIDGSPTGCGGGIYVAGGEVIFNNGKEFGIYNNIADASGDEISVKASTIEVPDVEKMNLPSQYKDLLWIKDSQGTRYRENHNDEVVDGGRYENYDLDLALGVVDFKVELNEASKSQFDTNSLTNRYGNQITWPFKENLLPIDARHIDADTKFTLWRSTDNFESDDNESSEKVFIANLIINEVPTYTDAETNETVKTAGPVKATVEYNEATAYNRNAVDNGDKELIYAYMRLGTVNESKRLLLIPENDDQNSYYEFTDSFNGNNTTTSDLPDKYYYRMSYVPATADDEVKAKYPDNIPVSWNDPLCRHSDVLEVSVPKGDLTMTHTSHTLEEIMNDGENNEWLEPSSPMANINIPDYQYNCKITGYEIFRKDGDKYTSCKKGNLHNTSNATTVLRDYDARDYLIVIKDENGNTFGGNIDRLKNLPSVTVKPVSIEKTDHENGVWNTTLKWNLSKEENGYNPGLYRLWFYDGNLHDTNVEPNHSHDITIPSAAPAKANAVRDADSDSDGHSVTVSPDSDMYFLTISHSHEHGYGVQPYESYRMRHYSVDDSDPSDPKYMVSEGTIYMKGNDNGTITGVEDVAVDNDGDTMPVFYDLTGIRVARPIPGKIYIVKRGNEVSTLLFN